MANNKKFVVKNGLQTQNVAFVSPNEANTINVTMLDSDALSVSGNSGQLFSITDSLTGTIFAVNDISGVPSIEVDDNGTIRFAELFGNVLIGTATNNGSSRLQVAGNITSTSTTTGTMVVTGGVGISGALYAGSIQATPVGSTTASTGAFTTLTANGATTFTANTASTSTTTGTVVITGGLGVSGRINAANFDGIVGANAAAAGSFTTLGASGNVTFSGANATITMSPTGTGSVTINPATAGTINNVSIGATTKSTGAFTTLTATSATTFTANTASSSTTTGTLVVTGGTGISGNLYVGGNTVITGNLQVDGTTTTVNSTTISVDDKNIELGSVASPTDTTADGGGITLKGTTDKTFNWVDATDAWTSSEHLNLLTGKAYYINGTSVLNATTLGSGVTSSSLTSVGTIGTGVWQGTSISTTYTDAKVTSVNSLTGAITAQNLLDAVKTVDGSASGLDADLLDGQNGSYYLDWTNVTNKPDPVVTVTLSGDVTGSANATLTDLASGTISVSTTIAANSVTLGTDTTGNYMTNVTAGGAITITHTPGEGSTATIAHADTSSQANVSNANGNVIQSATLDTYGHITGFTSTDLDGRYYTETEADTRFVNVTGDTMSGALTVNNTLTATRISDVRIAVDDIRNNLGTPTVEEQALFHGQFNNKFRFIPATLQEESTDGTTWVTSTRATADQLKDLMLGEGQSTNVIAIPTGTIGTYGGYRLTWDVVGITGYIFLNYLYVYNSTNGNTVNMGIEAFHNTNGWTSIVAAQAFGNWPGHTSLKHGTIGYSTAAAQYSRVRVTFSTTHNVYTNPFNLFGIEWFGGYPAGRRNVEYYDRDKNVYFPANIYSNGSLLWGASNDGAGSGLDADLLDGQQGSYYLNYNNLSNAPTIGNGTLTLAVSGTGLSGSQTFTANQATAATFTVTSNATNANTASTIVARDASGNFSAGTITATLSGSATSVVATVTGTNSTELVRGNMGDNDQARILVGATATNAGYLEIATADDGTEPIHVRQYTGVFGTLTRTATLLDGSGNTSFPGDLAVAGGDITTSTTGTATLFNTNATTVNIAGVSTATAIGAATGTTTIGNDLVVTGDLQVKGGDITTNQSAFNLLNATAATVNFAGAGTAIAIGAATGTTTINHDLSVNGGDIVTNQTTFNLVNATAATVNFAGAGTAIAIGATTGTTTVNHNLAVNGGTLSTNKTSFDLLNTTASTINFAGVGTAITVGGTSGTTTIRTPTVTLSNGTALNINGANPVIASSNTGTAAIFNANITTINFGQAADISMGGTAKKVEVRGNLEVDGNTILGDASTDTVEFKANSAIINNGLTFTYDDATNNNIVYPVKIRHTTSGTPAVNIGSGLEFVAETTANTNVAGVQISGQATAVTAGAEAFDFVVNTMTAGATPAQTIRANNSTITLGASSTSTTITTQLSSALTIRPGATTVTGVGNALTIQAGAGGTTTGNGGAATFQGGSASTSGAGGQALFRSGAAVGTNIVGADTIIEAGNGTGLGGSGNILFKTASVGSTGATANTMVTRFTITPSGNITINNDLTVNGNLTVNGTVTTLNSNVLTVDDKNLELGSVSAVAGLQATLVVGVATVTLTSGTTSGLIPGMTLTVTAGVGAFGASPTIASVDSATQITVSVVHATAGNVVFTAGGATDTTANNGGITLKGATDKTIIWDSGNLNWTSSENWNIATGKTFKIANVSVLSNVAVLQNATAASIGSTAAATTVTVGAGITGNILKVGSTAAGTANITSDVTTGTVNLLTGTTTGTITVGSAAAGKVSVAFNTASSSATTGALVVTGGVGVAGSIYTSGTIALTANSTRIQQASTSTWSGDAGAGQGKLEYHSNRWYVNAGTDSTEVVKFRRGATDVATIDNNGNLTISGDITITGGNAFSGTTQQRVKYGVWSDSTYGMGFGNGYTFGPLENDYAVTFQNSNTDARGFWWGDESHTNAQGAMALSTNGKLTVAHSIRVGFGESDTTLGGSVYTLEVNGAFAATTKSFLIDHPTKEGMKLRYGSLEGPENGVYVRGRLTGNNVIELPDYWTGLVDENTITVNLTPIGKSQNLYVKDIANNTVVVGGSRDINCFYTVFAERKDVDKLVVEIK